MVNEHYKQLNMIGLNPCDVIYKYIPYKYLERMIQNSSLLFKQVSKWEDVYENWFLKEQLILPTGEKGIATNIIPGVYGQSWTLLEESDAMWRIYSKLDRTAPNYLEETAIRIKTTVGKLFDVIYKEDKDMASSYIGKVSYLSQDDFRKMQDSLSPLSPLDLNEVFVKSYFVKREPFNHEEEVRPILIFSSDSENFGKDDLSYSIVFDELIDEMVCDPRLDPKEYASIREQLLMMGVKRNKISQSELYQLQQHTIQLK